MLIFFHLKKIRRGLYDSLFLLSTFLLFWIDSFPIARGRSFCNLPRRRFHVMLRIAMFPLVNMTFVVSKI